jgi:hypothetical protein
MANLDQFLQPLAVSSRVQGAVNDLGASAAAGGYAAWVQSVTGSPPGVEALPDGRARLTLTSEQRGMMQGWLDKQVVSVLQPPAEKPKVDFGMGEYLTPWAIKFFIPAGVGMFVLGWLAAYYFQR